jgi:hypothetical protein
MVATTALEPHKGQNLFPSKMVPKHDEHDIVFKRMLQWPH